MKQLFGVVLLLSALGVQAAPAAAPKASAPATARQTLEVSVDGLNCALCGEAMRTSLKKVANAWDIEPRLECGRIYLEVDPNATLNEAGLSFTLMSGGFNLKNVRPVTQTMAQVRAHKDC